MLNSLYNRHLMHLHYLLGADLWGGGWGQRELIKWGGEVIVNNEMHVIQIFFTLKMK